jgi:sugar phosphate isomerase/epimerase
MARFILSAFADEASGDIAGQIRALTDAGIRCVELRGVNGKSSKDLTLDEACEVRKQLAAAGIKVASMGSPFGKIGVRDDFEEHMRQFRHALDVCHALDCNMMRVFSYYVPDGEDPADCREEVMRRMDAMLDLAEAEGVTIAHENEKGIYGDTGDRCLDLMNEFGDRLGLIFDPANFIQVGDRPAEQFPKLEAYLTYMHIKDALLEDGSVVPSGCGDGSIEDILSALSSRRDDIVLSVEPHLTVFAGLDKLQGEEVKHKYAYPDSFTAFAAAVDALKGILTKIGYKEDNGIWTR